jgi:hypothetical protein
VNAAVLVPVKAFRDAKGRLEPVLSPSQRQQLARCQIAFRPGHKGDDLGYVRGPLLNHARFFQFAIDHLPYRPEKSFCLSAVLE